MSPSWPCWLVQRSAGPIGSGALASGSIRFFSSKMSSSWPCWLVQHSVGPIGPGAPDSDSMRPRHAGQGHAQHGQAERFASAAFVLHRQEFKSTCSRPCSPVVSVLLPSCMRVRFHVTHVPSLPAHSLLPSHHIPSCPNSVALSSFPTQTSLPAPLAVSSTASCPRGCFETENLHAQQRSPAFSQIQNSTEVLLPGPLSA